MNIENDSNTEQSQQSVCVFEHEGCEDCAKCVHCGREWEKENLSKD